MIIEEVSWFKVDSTRSSLLVSDLSDSSWRVAKFSLSKVLLASVAAFEFSHLPSDY
jgi:hypothetical protein